MRFCALNVRIGLEYREERKHIHIHPTSNGCATKNNIIAIAINNTITFHFEESFCHDVVECEEDEDEMNGENTSSTISEADDTPHAPPPLAIYSTKFRDNIVKC